MSTHHHHHHYHHHHHTVNVTATTGEARQTREPGFVRFPRDPQQEAKEKRRREKLAAMGPTEREFYDERLSRTMKEREERWLKEMQRLDYERMRRCGAL